MSILRRLAAGAKWGAIMGSLLAICSLAIALLNLVVNGSFAIRVRGVGTVSVLLPLGVYLIGGPAVGALAGLFRPLFRTRPGAALIGIIMASPLCGSIILFGAARTEWRPAHSFALVVATFALGVPGGMILREFLDEERSDERDVQRPHRKS